MAVTADLFLKILEPDAARLAAGRCHDVTLPAGAKAFRSGDACGAYLWLTKGSVKVHLVTESGRERLLYRVGPGDSCVLTTSCIFGHEPYAAEGLCETDVTAVAVPVAVFQELMATSRAFRDLVLTDYGRRVGDLLLLLDVEQSKPVADRLAGLLAEHAPGEPIVVTHQDLAVELGTAREVVSRVLKDLERRGFVALGRGVLTVTDRNALIRLAGS
jgi:CRP/FNR family transcriptional regulator